jgi:ubiquinone/menaquinone biosynthesis C-methylase UbiE
VNANESKYVEKKSYLSGYAHERTVALRESHARLAIDPATEAQWLKCVKEEFTQFVPFLTSQCGLEFRGRVLEIGAGAAWLSAEISKQPRVVEVIATDFSPKLLKEQAPRIFKLLNAQTAKITRMPADFHKLDFPDNHFDVVVCATVLHHASSIVQVLREAKRVLKPGGKFVAIREPIWPLFRLRSRAKVLQKLGTSGAQDQFYTLADYKEFFRQAALPLEVKQINLSSGLKYYVNKLVNGLTHARYAFIGTKRGPARRKPEPAPVPRKR